jgi:hypothetical protein
MSTNNLNPLNNTNCVTMCNVEQRLLGELIEAERGTYNVTQPLNQGLFNRNAIHTHGYKAKVKNATGLKWHLNLLLMIRKLDEQMFESLLEQSMFTQEKNYFEVNGYNCEIVPELQQYLK